MEPKERLQDFLTAMTEWEMWSHVEDRKTSNDYEWEKFSSANGLKPEDRSQCREKHWQEARERLMAIFTEFLTRHALEKIGAPRLISVRFAKPPSFDQDIENGYEQKRTHAYIYATHKRSNLYPRMKYDMTIEDGVWKIDTAFDWRQSLNKWEKVKAL